MVVDTPMVVMLMDPLLTSTRSSQRKRQPVWQTQAALLPGSPFPVTKSGAGLFMVVISNKPLNTSIESAVYCLLAFDGEVELFSDIYFQEGLRCNGCTHYRYLGG